MYSYEKIPEYMKKLKNWMIADYSKKKAPEDIDGNWRGSNPEYFVSFDKAFKITQTVKNKMLSFSITKESNLCCIDLDDCINENDTIKPWAKKILNEFDSKEVYIELSHSRKGIHIFCFNDGFYEKAICIKLQEIFPDESKKAGIEIYTDKKNIAMTGIIVTGNYTLKNSISNFNGVNKDVKFYLTSLETIKNKATTKFNNNMEFDFNDDIFKSIVNRLNIKHIITDFGIIINKNMALCPFHDEKTPSMNIFNNDKFFKCHGCGEFGDVIDFVMKYKNIDKIGAVLYLNDTYNLNLVHKKTAKREIFKNPNKIDNVKSEEKKPQDIFDEINKFLSETKKEKNIPLSENCFLPDNFKSGYYMINKGFCKRYVVNQENDIGEKEKMYVDKVIMPMVLYPINIYLVNGNEEIEFNKSIVAEYDSFSSVSKFKTWLKKFGSTIWFDGETKDLVNLEKYIYSYRNYTKTKYIISASKLGWFKNEFLPYNGTHIFNKNNSMEIESLVNSFTENGDFETWKENTMKYAENDTFRLYINTSLAAPLVSLLKRPSFWVHNHAKHSTGKTPAIYAAASIWAKPDSYAPAFNTSRVGLEFKLHLLNNLPCMFDDSQNLNEWNKKNISSMIYDLCNGSGKNRGNIQGDLQDSKNWYTTMLTNGERELLQGNEFEGAVKRLMEFDTIPFSDHREARKAREIYLNNYGFVGKYFIEILVKYKDEIKKLAEKLENIFENCNNFATHIQNVTSLCLCNYILNCYIFGIDQKKSIDMTIIWGKRILRLLPDEKEIDKIIIGLQLIEEYVMSNTHRFRIECPQGRIGFFRNGEVYFFLNEFKKLIKQWDIPEKRFLKEIKEMDCTITDDNLNFKLISHQGQKIRPVGFKNINITDLVEDIEMYN